MDIDRLDRLAVEIDNQARQLYYDTAYLSAYRGRLRQIMNTVEMLRGELKSGQTGD